MHATAQPKVVFKMHWLFDQRTDMVFFFLPTLIALAAYFVLQSPAVSESALWSFLLLQGMGLGPFHIGASWAHIKDRQIRERLLGRGKHRCKVLLVMLAIVVLSAIGMTMVPLLVVGIFMASTIHHLVQQNAGIISLYHNHGSEAVVARSVEVHSLHRAAWFCSFVFMTRFSQAGSWQQGALGFCAVISLLLCCASVRRYWLDLCLQARGGLPINGAALMFWMLSLGFLLPLAFLGRNYNEALLVPLVMHWFQYVALNWVLLRRKESSAHEIDGTRHGSVRYLVGISCVCTILILSLGLFANAAVAYESIAYKICYGSIMGIAMVHYLQDAFLWRFRDPIIRQSMLPYLKPNIVSSTHAAPSAVPVGRLTATVRLDPGVSVGCQADLSKTP